MKPEEARVTPIVAMTPKPEGDELLSMKEAARELGISRQHLSNLIHTRDGRPQLRYARLGTKIVIRRSWLDRWIDALARYEATQENSSI